MIYSPFVDSLIKPSLIQHILWIVELYSTIMNYMDSNINQSLINNWENI